MSVRATTPRRATLRRLQAAAVPIPTLCGHPGNEWGWAVGAGMTLKMPWDAKDTLSGQIAYAEGASKYVAFTYDNRALAS